MFALIWVFWIGDIISDNSASVISRRWPLLVMEMTHVGVLVYFVRRYDAVWRSPLLENPCQSSFGHCSLVVWVAWDFSQLSRVHWVLAFLTCCLRFPQTDYDRVCFSSLVMSLFLLFVLFTNVSDPLLMMIFKKNSDKTQQLLFNRIWRRFQIYHKHQIVMILQMELRLVTSDRDFDPATKWLRNTQFFYLFSV